MRSRRTGLRLLRLAGAVTVSMLLAIACGSNDKATKQGASVPAKGSDDARDVSHWLEADAADAATFAAAGHPLADADAVIERYERECAGASKPASCRAQRLEVEAIFLQSLNAVRASEQVADPRWYRLAAAAETPQLACIGLTELIWDPKRTQDDEALIARALDSPYWAVRGAVVMNAGKLPALADALRRSGGFDYSALSGVCVDDGRDAVPGSKWAGGYPNVRFRPHASNESRRWFTTADPPEKVIAWFAAQGKAARTGPQLLADDQQRIMDEMLRISSKAVQEPGDQERLMALMTGQGAQGHWAGPFRDMQGTDEIKYVMIGENQAIAIFRDHWLQATSIVATEPAVPLDLTPDIEAEKEKATMRSILHF